MIIKQALIKYAAMEIDLLLLHTLGKSREFLYMHPNHRLTASQTRRLSQMIKRREKGEPMAYILGYKDFCGLRFKLNKNVLIPRPETEELVELALNRMQNSECRIQNRKTIQILDVGTGSGCIAIALAKRIFDRPVKDSLCQITAFDISKKALAVARQNFKNILLNKYYHTSEYDSICRKIKFAYSDLLKDIKFIPDIIIANLPYGWQEWKNNTTVESIGIKFEPKQALFTKEKGLYEIHRLLKQIALLPSLPKYIYLEFDPRQKTELSKLIKKYLPSGDVKFHKDFNNLWRFAEITF